jgi:hypothetical protein
MHPYSPIEVFPKMLESNVFFPFFFGKNITSSSFLSTYGIEWSIGCNDFEIQLAKIICYG